MTGQLCAPPASFTKRIITSAKKPTGLVNEADGSSLKQFLQSLIDQVLRHRILYDEDNEIIKAISFHDQKWLPENATKINFNST
jgi:hypothetical protein